MSLLNSSDRGITKEEVKVLNEELFHIGAKQPLLSFGIWMLAPCIIEFGSEVQKREHLPKIIKGEIPCHKIYEDELVFSFLDINPCSTGHTLIVPKEQVETLDKLSEKSSMAIGRVLPITGT